MEPDGPDASASEWLRRVHGVELLESPDALLGRGECGEVRLGSMRSSDCTGTGIISVAVKIMEGPSPRAPRPLPVFPAHPNVVKVLRHCSTAERWVEVRSLCDGGELYDRIAEEGSLCMPEALHLFEQMVGAAAHCHSHGVAHGQLRAEHVLLGSEEQIQLLGFNQPSAKRHGVIVSSSAGGDRRSSGEMCGGGWSSSSGGSCCASPTTTPSVALRPVRPLDAPEWQLLRGRAMVEGSQLPPADVWTMSVLLLVMLTGWPPFSSSSPSLCPKYAQFCVTGLTSIIDTNIAAALPKSLLSLLERALRPDPTRRPTAAELQAALQAARAAVVRPPQGPRAPGVATDDPTPKVFKTVPVARTCQQNRLGACEIQGAWRSFWQSSTFCCIGRAAQAGLCSSEFAGPSKTSY